MINCNPISTPLQPHHNLHSSSNNLLPNATSHLKHCRCIAIFNYYTSWLDLCCKFGLPIYACSLVIPSQVVKHILQYIKGTVNYEIRLLSQSSLHLYGFSDTDLAGYSDTRRPTTRYCIFLGANCVTWSAKKQPIVARSSAEVEYCSMAVAALELTWITFLLNDIGVFLRTPPILYCDNISALYLTTNPIFHARKNHIEIA